MPVFPESFSCEILGNGGIEKYNTFKGVLIFSYLIIAH